jgi:hypothetical protein
MALSTTELRIATLSIVTLITMTPRITIKCFAQYAKCAKWNYGMCLCADNQNSESHFAECHYDEYHYDKNYHYESINMMSIVMISISMIS